MKGEFAELQRKYDLSTKRYETLASNPKVASIMQGQKHGQTQGYDGRVIKSSSSSPRDTCGSSPKAFEKCVPVPDPKFSIEGDQCPSKNARFKESSTPTSDKKSVRRRASSPPSPNSEGVSQKTPSTSTSSTCDQSSQTNPNIGSCSSIQELRRKACCGPTDLSDHRLIKQLFSIYWVWCHPVHQILSMQDFVDGYEAGTDTYCSVYLIYAVCIAACIYLDPRWEEVEGKYTDVVELRQNLMAEARRLEKTSKADATTTIQAAAIIACTSESINDDPKAVPNKRFVCDMNQRDVPTV